MSQPVEQGDHNQVGRPVTFRWRFIATEATRNVLVREMILERYRRFPLLLAITIVAAVALAVGIISVVLGLPFTRLTGVIMIAILVGPVVVQPIRSIRLSNQTTEQFFTSGYEYESAFSADAFWIVGRGEDRTYPYRILGSAISRKGVTILKAADGKATYFIPAELFPASEVARFNSRNIK